MDESCGILVTSFDQFSATQVKLNYQQVEGYEMREVLNIIRKFPLPLKMIPKPVIIVPRSIIATTEYE